LENCLLIISAYCRPAIVVFWSVTTPWSIR